MLPHAGPIHICTPCRPAVPALSHGESRLIFPGTSHTEVEAQARSCRSHGPQVSAVSALGIVRRRFGKEDTDGSGSGRRAAMGVNAGGFDGGERDGIRCGIDRVGG